MNALSKLFETLHLSRRETASRRSLRRRRARRQGSALLCETLEPKQLLAADLVAPISADPVVVTDAPVAISLEGKFDDDAVFGTVVKFETNAPLADDDFYVELTDNTPLTNANFLSYVNSGAYDNSKFHRSVSDFVIQGGGFKAPTVAADQPGSDPVAIPTTGTVQNEPGNLNTRGTIAMAKLGGQPDSATSQFFFNLSDNSFLDSDNGGYTQFGSVLGSGMTVVDTIGSALTYDATTYYSNTALSDLPLWNVNQDNIVRPQDFAQINNADVVTESALFTYQVSSSDSAKLTATFDGNGNLVLTPDSGATGSVEVTVTATSKLDNTTASDTFSVQLNGGGGGGPVEPVLTAIESAGNTVLNQDQDGKLYAGDQPIIYGGSQITVTQFGGYTPVAVEDFGSSKQLVFEKTDGNYFTWTLTDSWGYASGALTSSSSPSLSTFLSSFGLAAPTPSFTALESSGSTVLNRDDSGKLYAGDQPIIYGSSQITVTQFGGFTPVAIEDFGSSKQLAFETTNGDYFTWTLTETWGYTSGAWTRSTSPSLSTFLSSFGLAAPPPSFTAIESAGSTVLNRDADGNLFAGDQPIIYGGSQITVTRFGGFTPVAIEDFGSSKQLAFETTNGDYFTWTLTETWGYTSGAWTRSTSPSLSTFLSSFGLAAPPPSFTAIESAGSTVLNRDADGNLFAGDQPIIYGGSQITVTRFGGFTPVAIEDFGSSKQLAFETTNGDYFTWTLTETWGYTSGAWTRSTSPSLSTFLSSFGLAAPPPSFTAIESAGSTVLNRDADGNLFAGDQPIIYGGSQITVTQFGGFTPVAIEDFGSSKQLAFETTNGDYFIWTVSNSWSYTSGRWVRLSDSAGHSEIQTTFGIAG